MSSSEQRKVPAWFWVVASLALLWNLAGVAAFIGDITLSDEALAALPQVQRELRAATPLWVTAVYGLAVGTGLAGALALLLRSQWTVHFFAVSLAAVVVQMAYVLFVLGAVAALGPSVAVFPAVIILIAAALVWFSLKAWHWRWLAHCGCAQRRARWRARRGG